MSNLEVCEFKSPPLHVILKQKYINNLSTFNSLQYLWYLMQEKWGVGWFLGQIEKSNQLKDILVWLEFDHVGVFFWYILFVF